ncbi:hypothetical protein KIN20_008152 [Parelaphostrongylus tenuis]|uniref:Uncharacterized protein n=1 Tax=Parelaphostrongylus tenuis TaxID=148309 RepID=A0AAD5QJM3_PARTN|nr:hypothetical protein KIN20_008152 [Parelaphostrongylus tenuis]
MIGWNVRDQARVSNSLKLTFLEVSAHMFFQGYKSHERSPHCKIIYEFADTDGVMKKEDDFNDRKLYLDRETQDTVMLARDISYSLGICARTTICLTPSVEWVGNRRRTHGKPVSQK